MEENNQSELSNSVKKVTEEVVVDLNSLKPVQGAGIDLKKYDKKEVEIEGAEVIQVNSNYSECKTQWVLKVQSVVLETLERDEGNIEFRASELFNLIQDEAGKLQGYPEAEGSNLQQFMADIGAKSPEDIAGKKTLIKAFEKNDKTFLKFRY